MSPRAIRPAEAIFLALSDLTSEEREALLRERCGGDPALRAEVIAMLHAVDDPDDGFLDPALIPTLDMNAVDGPLQPGTPLGRFLVLHAIGSGGMGVVYAAEQDRPRRTVAIKVLRRGFRHPDVVKRFEREAEFLGRLQHPAIAQVFAFHPGDRQAPAHLVMELVGGLPVTEYARAHSLSIAARVELVAKICDGVQHAHERGVIHRDLKPANVLVGNDGQPKILDFGVARATGLDVQSAVQTSHGQLIGTLAYMSPEQLQGNTSAVDERSDIYALGILLYRLLTGRLPFDLVDLPWLEAATRILQTDPPLVGSIDRALAGPLEQMTAHAMARTNERRYQSAAQLGADLRSYLAGGHTTYPDPSAARAAAVPAALPVATRADGRRLAIRSFTLRDDGCLVVCWDDGRKQVFQPLVTPDGAVDD